MTNILKPFFQSLETVGVFPEVVENYNSYKEGTFAECTKLFVDNKEETRDILEKYLVDNCQRNGFLGLFE